MNKKPTETTAMLPVVQEIKLILNNARHDVARQINNELLNTYWNIGRIIAEYEQFDPGRADYGKQTLKELAKILTNEFGKGFSGQSRLRRGGAADRRIVFFDSAILQHDLPPFSGSDPQYHCPKLDRCYF